MNPVDTDRKDRLQ